MYMNESEALPENNAKIPKSSKTDEFHMLPVATASLNPTGSL
jgi:hypothetical protein